MKHILQWKSSTNGEMNVRDGHGMSVLEPTIGAGVQVFLLMLLWASVGLDVAGWLTGVAYTVACWVILVRALRRRRVESFGPANRITLARSTLVGGVAALVVSGMDGEGTSVAAIVVLAASALILDGIDGLVARRTATVSALGARFDMEVDAFLLLVLSVYVAQDFGAWVLIIGVMRYVFAAVGRTAPWLRAQLPPSFARKFVAALQGIVLVTVAAGIAPRQVSVALISLALILLVWSFGRDVLWLWRGRLRHVENRNESFSGADPILSKNERRENSNGCPQSAHLQPPENSSNAAGS